MNVTLADNLMAPQKQHSHEELKAAFDKICDKDNWKMPLRGVVEESELGLVEEAAIYFAGSPLHIVKKMDDGKVMVAGAGYYECIGS